MLKAYTTALNDVVAVGRVLHVNDLHWLRHTAIVITHRLTVCICYSLLVLLDGLTTHTCMVTKVERLQACGLS